MAVTRFKRFNRFLSFAWEFNWIRVFFFLCCCCCYCCCWFGLAQLSSVFLSFNLINGDYTLWNACDSFEWSWNAIEWATGMRVHEPMDLYRMPWMDYLLLSTFSFGYFIIFPCNARRFLSAQNVSRQAINHFVCYATSAKTLTEYLLHLKCAVKIWQVEERLASFPLSIQS